MDGVVEETRVVARQVVALLKKHGWIMTRSKRSSFLQISAPFWLLLVLFIMNEGVKSGASFDELSKAHREFDVERVPGIPLCVADEEDHCVTLAYVNVPGHPAFGLVERIMAHVAASNDPVLPAAHVVRYDSAEDLHAELVAHPNVTQGAYVFNTTDFATAADFVHEPRYTLAFNHTVLRAGRKAVIINPYELVHVPMTAAMERATLLCLDTFDGVDECSPETSTAELVINKVEMAHPELSIVDILEGAGPVFLYGAVLFQFVSQLSLLVGEKESGVRTAMSVMGMRQSAYFLAHYIASTVIATIATFVMVISGHMFGFAIFTQNAFGLYFFAFWLVSQSMLMGAVLVSTMVTQAKSASNVGVLIFVLGLFMMFGAELLYSSSVPKPLRQVLSLLSPLTFQRSISLLSRNAYCSYCTGVSWGDRYTHEDIAPVGEMFDWMVAQFFLQMVLAWYLDHVLPSATSTPRLPPWFLFTREYWAGRATVRRPTPHAQTWLGARTGDVDDDVVAERRRVETHDVPPDTTIVIDNVAKVYPRKVFRDTPDDFVAVNGVSLTVQSNSLLGLLGPNGAGKTTLIKMCIGAEGLTFGDITIGGYSVLSDMSQIRRIMGVCPQFDVLWPEMCGMEHLMLFSELKGLDPSTAARECMDMLKEVQLDDVATVRAGSYSGGMRRRLSVAIALLGDPRVVLLDEPTTGMDPVSKRHVWSIIERAKKRRCIVLTSHSMEEVDVLANRIAIVARGSLRCVASSIRLKNKFGTGYRVSTLTRDVAATRAFFTEHFAAAVEEAELPGALVFNVPRAALHEMSAFFDTLDAHKEAAGVTDVQLSMSTLEEVFIRIAEAAKAEGMQQTVYSLQYLKEHGVPLTQAYQLQQQQAMLALQQQRAHAQASPHVPAGVAGGVAGGGAAGEVEMASIN